MNPTFTKWSIDDPLDANHLPFESLIADQELNLAGANAPSGIRFLLEDFVVSYAPSATVSNSATTPSALPIAVR